jgi:hypothetical protein
MRRTVSSVAIVASALAALAAVLHAEEPPPERRSVKAPIRAAPEFLARIEPDPVLVFDDPDRTDKDPVLCTAHLVVQNFRRQPWSLYGMLAPDDRFQARSEKQSAFQFTMPEQELSTELRFMVPVTLLDKGDLEAKTILWTKEFRYASAPTARFRRVPLKLPTPVTVGVVRTPNAAAWDALQTIAAQCNLLRVVEATPAFLRDGDLNQFDTILVEPHAARLRMDLHHQRERLRAYMERGGNVVVLAHDEAEWNAQPGTPPEEQLQHGHAAGQLAPYPIRLSAARVTDEKAPVKLLKPDHPLLTYPCKIWEKDFAGWVFERGANVPDSWDEHYTPLLSCADPDEKAQEGGLLAARVGKGSFIYTSLSLPAQWRAGVPGAYRLLANLVAYKPPK